jgi:predicted nucleotidyltransferase
MVMRRVIKVAKKSIDEIKKIVSEIAEQYGAEKVYLFGSYARGEERDDSDIDLHVYQGDIFGFEMCGFYGDLEEKLENQIDLVIGELIEDTTKRYKTTINAHILAEEILLYERA